MHKLLFCQTFIVSCENIPWCAQESFTVLREHRAGSNQKTQFWQLCNTIPKKLWSEGRKIAWGYWECKHETVSRHLVASQVRLQLFTWCCGRAELPICVVDSSTCGTCPCSAHPNLEKVLCWACPWSQQYPGRISRGFLKYKESGLAVDGDFLKQLT